MASVLVAVERVGWVQGTYRLVRSAVLVGHLLALLAEGLDEARVDDEFLGDGVAREFPGELVLPARGLVVVLGVDDVVVVGADLLVVLLDGVADGRHGFEWGGGEEA